MRGAMNRQDDDGAISGPMVSRRVFVRAAVLAITIALVQPLVGCQQDGTQELTRKQVGRLEEKMTMHEVEKLLGRPYVRGDMSYVYRPKKGVYSEVEVIFDDREKLSTYSLEER